MTPSCFTDSLITMKTKTQKQIFREAAQKMFLYSLNNARLGICEIDFKKGEGKRCWDKYPETFKIFISVYKKDRDEDNGDLWWNNDDDNCFDYESRIYALLFLEHISL